MGNIPRMEMRSGSLNTIRNETGRGTADGGTTKVFHQMLISKVSIMLTGIRAQVLHKEDSGAMSRCPRI